jgi:hypothetical protein
MRNVGFGPAEVFSGVRLSLLEKRLIAVLIDGARMPEARDLPESLRQLARRNAVKVNNDEFSRDAAVLVEKV